MSDEAVEMQGAAGVVRVMAEDVAEYERRGYVLIEPKPESPPQDRFDNSEAFGRLEL